MISKILVPMDGSPVAESILPYVCQLTKSMSANVVALSVVEPRSVEIPKTLAKGYPEIGHVGWWNPQVAETQPRELSGVPYSEQMYEEAEKLAWKHLRSVLKLAKMHGVEAKAVVKFSKPADEIIRVAEEEGCDLIAMTTHGRTALGRGILGSVTDKVIHSSNIPVLTITPEIATQCDAEGTRIENVVVPLDGSLMAEAAIPYAEALSSAMKLKIILTRVVRPAPVEIIAGKQRTLVNAIRDEAIKYIDNLADTIRKKGYTVEAKLPTGNPANEIISIAPSNSRSLIAMTTHGRSGITRWVLGSVTEAVIRASATPVLVIPIGKSG